MVNLRTRCYHHKDNSLLTGGISCSSLCWGCFTISSEVNIISVFYPNWLIIRKFYLCRSLQFVSIYKFKAVMNQGRYVFMQLVDFLPRKNFEWLVKKYESNKYIKKFKGEKGNRVGGKKEGKKKREKKRPQGLSLRVFIIFCPYRGHIVSSITRWLLLKSNRRRMSRYRKPRCQLCRWQEPTW